LTPRVSAAAGTEYQSDANYPRAAVLPAAATRTAHNGSLSGNSRLALHNPNLIGVQLRYMLRFAIALVDNIALMRIGTILPYTDSASEHIRRIP